jgi:hypothetical protein
MQIGSFQIIVPGPEALASAKNLLEMEILQPYHRPTETKTLGWDIEICVLTTLQVILMLDKV